MSRRQCLSTALRQCHTAPLSHHQTPQITSQIRPFSSSPSVSRFQNIPKPKPVRQKTSATSDLVDLFNSDRKFSPDDIRQSRYDQARKATDLVAKTEHARKAISDTAITQAYAGARGRQWKVGDIYAPRDMTAAQARMAMRGNTWRPKDVVDALGFNPVDNYKNYTLISQYVTHFGRIEHSQKTGLRPVNQRKMAKAIRRAIGLGLYPSVYKYPEILMRTPENLPYVNRSVKPKKGEEVDEISSMGL